VERRTQEIGRELLREAHKERSGSIWSEKLIAWSLEDEGFKTELFRFVDVFPVLKSAESVHQHLVEYLQQPGLKPPAAVNLALKAGGLLKGTLAATVEGQIRSMAGRFIAGATLADAAAGLKRRWEEGIAFSLDLLGEAVVSHPEAAAYRGRYAELLERLPGFVEGLPERAALERDHLGAIPRANVSIKISALDGHVSPVDAGGSVERLYAAIAPLLETARAHNIFINFDMEHHALKDLTIRLFKRCCERFDFHAGLALQAYLRSAEADVLDLMEWSRAQGRVVTVRLIKGAYWDYETIHAQMQNWPSPVWSKKGETDACFERLTDLLLRQVPRDGAGAGGIKVALGTHNARSVAHAIARAEQLRLPQEALEFQALRGMADDLKRALARGAGSASGMPWRVREYTPLGELVPGMAYLVRRLLENTSNQGWLRAGTVATEEELLRAPAVDPAEKGTGNGHPAPGEEGAFGNEPLRDFSQPDVREAFGAAVDSARFTPVENDGTPQDAAIAVEKASAAFPGWRDTAAAERCGIIERAAGLLRESRDAISGLIVAESHKTWQEADADVCEAIDFCRYYARQALRLFTPERLGAYAGPGELNHGFHEPRGVAAVIAPWNFPLSIPTGMTVAALVTGNTVILKPAEQTPAIARRLCEVLWQAGVPRGVLQFLPGPGETVGDALVRDPRVSIIAFTGSREVGLRIVRVAGEMPPEQQFVKRVICEMGGKNAMIVDASADLDEAVLAVRQSAFSYAGQKCSAGSRLILPDAVHDLFLTRLVEATDALVAGDPRDPGTDVGPVIDAEAAEKIRRYIEIGRREAKLVYPQGSKGAAEEGTLIRPHIFAEVRPESRLAREEIFGPVLAVLRARDFDHALELANDSSYKLTGGVFSRTPSHLERARREFRVGNLYLNRGITGALVGRQPFGGFGLSGVGSKAGGPHYLLQFTDPRNMTENTLRRGFAPMKDVIMLL
jgi:RHH-type proline utilization regulon transcriptional repressor/proline dehydrogenase/delta 1-pyrroline-5-carboxylate dehydrogenase